MHGAHACMQKKHSYTQIFLSKEGVNYSQLKVVKDQRIQEWIWLCPECGSYLPFSALVWKLRTWYNRYMALTGKSTKLMIWRCQYRRKLRIVSRNLSYTIQSQLVFSSHLFLRNCHLVSTYNTGLWLFQLEPTYSSLLSPYASLIYLTSTSCLSCRMFHWKFKCLEIHHVIFLLKYYYTWH